MTDEIKITEMPGYSEAFDAMWEFVQASPTPPLAALALLNMAGGIVLSMLGPDQTSELLRAASERAELAAADARGLN